MRAVNLLPRDDVRRGREKPDGVVLAAVLAAVVLTAMLAGLFLMSHAKVVDKQQQLEAARDELAAIPTPPPAQSQTEEALVADKQKRVTALGAALGRRVTWDRVLREMALVLPEDVWLKSLTAHAPVSPAAAAEPEPPAAGVAKPAPTGFILDGYTYSHDAVARFMTRLQIVPDLVDVQLQHSSRTRVGTREIIEFRIIADVRRPGAAPS